MEHIRRDHFAGLLLIVLGSCAIYFVRNLSRGVLERMGPGYFPTAIGVILIVLGIAIAATASKKEDKAAKSAEGGESVSLLEAVHSQHSGESHKADWRGWSLIILSFVAFILLFDRAGVFPATVAITVLAAYAERGNNWKSAVGLAIFMCLFAYFVFYYALKMPLHLFWWD